ncbi:MAG: RNA polymerase sigma factor [Ruminococcus sp.]|nr:RNA polymerase sigma factor [Ruminococcus sp.]
MKSDFDSYVTKYSADLTRLCISLCGSRDYADDLFQETWLKALRHYKKRNADVPFDKWLYSICVNTYKNVLLSARHRKSYHFRTDEEQTEFFNSIPEVNDENRDDYSTLHYAISALPKKQKIVIVLYYFKDYSIKDIALIVNAPEGTVKSRLSTARKALERRLINE